jgi:acyl-CoA ligase (AMP-forming) (exosortase A-associated)
MAVLLHELIFDSAQRTPGAVALRYQGVPLSYEQFARQLGAFAALLREAGVQRGERVATFLEKRHEAVVGMFGANAAGAVFVPVNPLLKGEQVGYILKDCNVRVLVTSSDRYESVKSALATCEDLRAVVLVDGKGAGEANLPYRMLAWPGEAVASVRAPGVIDADMAAILYTSGSTGRPKGVVLSHRNVVAGARSVAQYLGIHSGDRILSVLPLSFDYGLNQLTTSFLTGATAVLMNHLLARDVISLVAKESITGLAAVPPLWVQLAQLPWASSINEHLRYFTNSGGHMPKPTLDALRAAVPKAKPFLMYGLTEAFRSTYLPPEEVDRRPDSIGKAIPNAEIMVVREDGTPCAPNEEGELVHRGVHVSLGYWNDVAKTAERFKPAPGQPAGLTMPEIAVWSGDTVRKDEDGFIYFVGRRDEMIKTSGYRVSPTEIEEVMYQGGLVEEAAAFGVSHPTLGQGVVAVVLAKPGKSVDEATLKAACQKELPAFMVPLKFDIRSESLPRNPNGKIDRKKLSGEFADLFG